MMRVMMMMMMLMTTTTKVPSLFRPSPLLRALLYEASCNCWKVEHLIIVIDINIVIIVINITIVIIEISIYRHDHCHHCHHCDLCQMFG